MDDDVRMSEVQPTGRKSPRLRQTVWDMVRSMAVVLAVVFLIVLLAWRPQPDAVKVIDPVPVLTGAAAQADFPVLAPTGLAEGWRPTSARWQPTEDSESAPVMHVGYVTPTDAYAQVSQSTARSAAYLDEQTAGGQAVGQRDIDGTTWEQWETADRKSLVLGSGPAMVIVSGTGSWEELASLAASLAPVTAP